MQVLPSIDPETAGGEAAQLLTATHRALGVVPNLAKVMANNPAVLKGYLANVNTLGDEGTLPTGVAERIALLIAQEHKSDYCLSAHSFRGINLAGLSVAEVTRARAGETSDPWAAAALALATAVVRRHGAISDDQLAMARHAGLSDGQVVEIVAHVALNVLTTYLATAARVDIDWPLVRHTD
ncbi:carboxymuconolactone decarboxylase family protein [Streptomyces sp. NPDC053493]|uniref:carboxymuconolactone decarboxylase family protein n=1 Tax=Streptomyces sp. NPDC053493 TaxID=3365705 RepID=UPI0037D35E42